MYISKISIKCFYELKCISINQEMYFSGDPGQESSADTITGSIVVAEAKTDGDMQDFVRESLNSAYI